MTGIAVYYHVDVSADCVENDYDPIPIEKNQTYYSATQNISYYAVVPDSVSIENAQQIFDNGVTIEELKNDQIPKHIKEKLMKKYLDSVNDIGYNKAAFSKRSFLNMKDFGNLNN